MKKVFVRFLFKFTGPLLFIGKPLTYLSAAWLKFVKLKSTGNYGDKIFMKLGILPILDHYYQPLINPKKHLKKSLRDDRPLPGIDFNTAEQLDLLSKFKYNDELLQIPVNKTKENEFFYENKIYYTGDAEYLYNIIRHFKPGKIIEIGSGHSTLMTINALRKNKSENIDYTCRHICIEPYEQPWLAELDIELIREKAENIDISFFQQLGPNDILFIDSSHIIRPQGDVLFEYLELIPSLNPGVIIHVHDIFSPKDYLTDWVMDHHLLWNEQYLLEAFLSCNPNFKIIGALNYLTHHYRKELAARCPIFANQPWREPGAFWFVRK